MSYFKTKKAKEPYLTASDRERIARIDSNPHLVNRKLKVQMVLKHPKIKAEVCIAVYGKDKDMLKEKITANLADFQTFDKKWKLAKVIDLKASSDEDT